MNRWQRYLTKEIAIEFKACVYFFCILFFYSVYRIATGSFEANIIAMAEIIVAVYIMGYAQVYLFHNFDEADSFGLRESAETLLCSLLYTAVSYMAGWYERNNSTTILFFVYMLLCYLCVFWVYKIKRNLETKQLNKSLEAFKRHAGNE
jgi:hypothetical protein